MVRIYFLGPCDLPNLTRLCWAAFLAWVGPVGPVLCACGEAFLPWLRRAGWLGGGGSPRTRRVPAVAVLRAGRLSGPSCWLSASAVVAPRARTGLPGSDGPSRAFQGANQLMKTSGPRGGGSPQPHQDGDQQSRSLPADLAPPSV